MNQELLNKLEHLNEIYKSGYWGSDMLEDTRPQNLDPNSKENAFLYTANCFRLSTKF